MKVVLIYAPLPQNPRNKQSSLSVHSFYRLQSTEVVADRVRNPPTSSGPLRAHYQTSTWLGSATQRRGFGRQGRAAVGLLTSNRRYDIRQFSVERWLLRRNVPTSRSIVQWYTAKRVTVSLHPNTSPCCLYGSMAFFLVFTCVSYAEARNSYRLDVVRPSVCLSVCLSVRPSHSGTLSKRLNILSWFLHHTIAHSF